MNRGSQLKLPVGEKPGWELDDSEDENPVPLGLKSIAESSVILLSLKQSRDKWLSSTFPKFSSKARGGRPAEIVPLPHTIQSRGRCDIEIGPHIFSDTIIFEVHYLPPQPPASAAKPGYLYQPPSMTSGSWQATTPYGGPQYHTYGQQTSLPKFSTPESISQPSSKPLLSSLTSSVSITPTLISQVNSAASSNPTLANLLQLAAAGKANSDQLKTLGLLIQSLANANSDVNASSSGLPSLLTQTTPHASATKDVQKAASTSTSVLPQNSTYTYLPPVREFDIVLEFQESMSERWIFPRGPVVCERVPSTWTADASCDILISTRVPFPKVGFGPDNLAPDKEKEGSPADDILPRLVTFRLKRAPIAVWDTIYRWVGSEENVTKNRKIIEELKDPARVFLGYQLPQGSLLTQVQNAANPPFNTRPIKPGQGTSVRPKRKVIRKPVVPATDSQPPMTPAQKRKRPSQAKVSNAVSQIACFTCGQVDVPLIMGGRFCRPCVEAGKAIGDIPKAGGSHVYPYKTSITIPPSTKPTPDSSNVSKLSTPGDPPLPDPPASESASTVDSK